jgi:hypothetical protein
LKAENLQESKFEEFLVELKMKFDIFKGTKKYLIFYHASILFFLLENSLYINRNKILHMI